jgi:hypothetical protein
MPADWPPPLFHKLYALDTVLPDLGRPTKAQLEKAMQGHVLAQAELVGTYQGTFMLYNVWQDFGDYFRPPPPRPDLFLGSWSRVGQPPSLSRKHKTWIKNPTLSRYTLHYSLLSLSRFTPPDSVQLHPVVCCRRPGQPPPDAAASASVIRMGLLRNKHRQPGPPRWPAWQCGRRLREPSRQPDSIDNRARSARTACRAT